MERFRSFFKMDGLYFLKKTIRIALDEDGRDITSSLLFSEQNKAKAVIVCKEDVVIAGLPLISMIFEELKANMDITYLAEDGDFLRKGSEIVEIYGSALGILKAERVILNFLCHLSGIATFTKRFVDIASRYGVVILDTRKTLPGLRYPEKYAVLVGGGKNHRFSLNDMILVKDTHIDGVGSLDMALEILMERKKDKSLKVVVECRGLEEVMDAVRFDIDRIMLDNMDVETAKKAIDMIPKHIEVEISGGINLTNIEEYAKLKPDYISVGRIIHSARYVDLSMRIKF